MAKLYIGGSYVGTVCIGNTSRGNFMTLAEMLERLVNTGVLPVLADADGMLLADNAGVLVSL